jgi:CcmD family protein
VAELPGAVAGWGAAAPWVLASYGLTWAVVVGYVWYIRERIREADRLLGRQEVGR